MIQSCETRETGKKGAKLIALKSVTLVCSPERAAEIEQILTTASNVLTERQKAVLRKECDSVRTLRAGQIVAALSGAFPLTKGERRGLVQIVRDLAERNGLSEAEQIRLS